MQPILKPRRLLSRRNRILCLFLVHCLRAYGALGDNRALMISGLLDRRSDRRSYRHWNRLWFRLAPALAFGLAVAMFSAAPASAADAIAPVSTANELLREAISREKLGLSDGYLAWTDRVQKPRGSITKLMVNTPQGILSRVVAIDDQPLSPEERRQDDQRIDRLLDPAKMQEKFRKQQEDREHVEHLLYALPEAFQCEYSAAVPQDGTLHLECSPNPAFSPPNYESQLLPGMKAEIAIDREEKRITRVVGTLFKEVTFGWGFLARLKSGGRIEITQSKVAGKRWVLTHMQLRFDGHLVMVKPLHVEESKSCWNYRPVPAMTVAQALEFLRNTSIPTAPR